MVSHNLILTDGGMRKNTVYFYINYIILCSRYIAFVIMFHYLQYYFNFVSMKKAYVSVSSQMYQCIFCYYNKVCNTFKDTSFPSLARMRRVMPVPVPTLLHNILHDQTNYIVSVVTLSSIVFLQAVGSKIVQYIKK